MKEATLAFLVRRNTVWLAMKKTGFGKGKYNGFGGKLLEGETIEDSLLRELKEEANVCAISYEKMGEISYTFPGKPDLNHHVHIYIVNQWYGIPQESKEMSPELFEFNNIPYEKMWSNDQYWLPHVLKGRKIEADIVQDEHKTISYDVRKL